MGQCSTLPAGDHLRHQQPSSSVVSVQQPPQPCAGPHEKKTRLSEGGRQESLDFNVIVPQTAPAHDKHQQFHHHHGHHQPPPVAEFSTNDVTMKPVDDPALFEQRPSGTQGGPQTREEHPMEEDHDAMDVVDSREQAPPPITPIPEGAVRTRCYKLNLNSEYSGLSSSQKQNVCLGPFTEPPPFLTCSSSEDSVDVSPTKVAIRTAQIFRGITVGRDGTILSQNARATRSNRGNKTKRGEKSRQAAKIDKAKDLVEESINNSKKDDGEDSKMVSLFIVGEYDDMKQLVRDGAKKLREAEGLPDEALLSINRMRAGAIQPPKAKPVAKAPVAPSSLNRKRSSASPNFVNSQRTAAMQAPEHMPVAVTAQPVSPPKLKSHPRDTRPTRREDRASMRMRLDSCSDFMDPRQSGVNENGDWSHAWNLWNCVGSGAVSPRQTHSPNDTAKVVYEGRESTFTTARESGITGRAN